MIITSEWLYNEGISEILANPQQVALNDEEREAKFVAFIQHLQALRDGGTIIRFERKADGHDWIIVIQTHLTRDGMLEHLSDWKRSWEKVACGTEQSNG